MRSCVIGGAGFIGNYLVQELLASGREVVVLGRRSSAPAERNASLRYIRSTTDSPAALREVLAGVDEVVDLAYASVPQVSGGSPLPELQANLPLALRLYEAAGEVGVRKIVMVSSGGTVYGPAHVLPINESAATNPVSSYGIAKLALEKSALMLHHLRALPIMVARPANAFGEGQKPFTGQGFMATAMGMILQRRPVTIFGAQGTVRDYIHARDVARGLLAMLEHGRPGATYNIGSGIGRNNLEVLEAIRPLARACSLSVDIDFQPARPFDVAANVLDCRKLNAEAGWEPIIPFEAGLASMWHTITKQILS